MKSFILSVLLTGFLFYAFISLIDPNNQTWVSKISSSVGYLFIIGLGIGYFVAFYWGVSGIINGQRIANLLGILISLFGLGLFLFGYSMEMGKGKAKPGQFDTSLTTENTTDIVALQPLLEQANLKKSDIKLLTYWDLLQSKDKFAVCMQKERVIGLSINNVKLQDISCISELSGLSSLTLNGCEITVIENLRLPRAERLNLNNNLLKNLTGIEALNVKWLDVENNRLSSFEGIDKLPQAQYFNYKGNNVIDYSALINHPYLKPISVKQ